MNEIDERIHIADRGKSRDIGRNPAFDGTLQRGVKPSNADAIDRAMAVGGAFEQNDRVRSFAASSVQIGPYAGVVVEGAGALRGVSMCIAGASQPFTVRLHSGSLVGTIIASFVLGESVGLYSIALWFGDFGINFDSLFLEYVDVITGAAVTPPIIGTVNVASVE